MSPEVIDTVDIDEVLRAARLKDAAPAMYEALRKIADGDVPEQPASKHERCRHGRFGWDDCGLCIADYARAILSQIDGE